nr:MAG TPA_asm: antitoxin [Caudoviricetes sp.]
MARGGKREGAGRPVGTKTGRTVEYKTISISALPEEVGIIKEAAKKAGKTVSRYLIELVISDKSKS